jgi:tripartite-type tricarboxylate transporter receptor subunit TctC
MNDLLAGQVGIKMDTIATATPHIKGGRLKPLAIASAKRSPLMPDVPTIAESGLPGYQGILWMGVLLPAGADAALVSQLHKASVQAMQQPDMQKQLAADGVEIVASDPAAFSQLIATEITQWADVVKRSKIKAD